MALHAVEDVDDALDLTRGFLASVDRSAWLKLALVALFLGAPGANVNSVQYSFGGGDVPATVPEVVVPPGVWLLVAAAVAVGLVIALAVALVGSVMEFVFVESLRSETVAVRRYWRRRWRQGLRLFGFRVAIGALVFGSFAVLAVPFVLSAVSGSVGEGLSIAVFLALLPFFGILAIVLGVVYGFTTVFVVPVMILEDVGVLAGWRRLWPTITAHWRQYLAYAVIGLFLTLLGGILVGIVTAVLALLLLVPFGLLGAVGAALVVVAPPVGWAVVAVVGVLFVLAVIAVAAVVQVPVHTYLRYYALLVLGDVEPDLDLVPDQRAAIRASATDE